MHDEDPAKLAAATTRSGVAPLKFKEPGEPRPDVEDDGELNPAELAARIPRSGYRTTPNADVDAVRRR